MSSALVDPRPGPEPAPVWTRQKGEPAGAFACFVVYRDQTPPRSIAKAARALGRAVRPLKEWSRKWNWVERAAEYTAYLDRLQLAVTEEDIVRRRREENERLYYLGSRLQDLAGQRLDGVVTEAGQPVVAPIDANMLDPDEVVRFFEAGYKATRLAHGLPTDLRGSLQISVNDLQRILSTFLTIAERHMDAQTHEAYVRDCWAYVRERLGE